MTTDKGTGLLITFEGIDGCGKSTQIQLLKRWLSEQERSFEIFREPGGTEISERIRELLLDARNKMDTVTELLLFSAARSQLISEKVKPLLDQDVIVILDRFYDSTTAYQGYGRKSANLDQIHQLNRLAGHGLVPDITLYLKISYKEAQKRTESEERDRMEIAGDDFFKRVIDGFDQLSLSETRFKTIDATRDTGTIHEEIVKILQRHLS